MPAWRQRLFTARMFRSTRRAWSKPAFGTFELGLRSDKSFAMRDGIFTLRGRVAWAHDYNTDRNIGAPFQTLPGAMRWSSANNWPR
jgi:hypothetical protein